MNIGCLELDRTDKLVEFLDSIARDLHDLNQYADSPLLDSKFGEFLTGIKETRK